MKRTQFHAFAWGLLMAFGKKVLIETTPQEVLAIIGVEAMSYPSLLFSSEELPSKGDTTLCH